MIIDVDRHLLLRISSRHVKIRALMKEQEEDIMDLAKVIEVDKEDVCKSDDNGAWP